MAPEADQLEDIFAKNDELSEVAENERHKIADLQDVISYLRKENVMYKQKYNGLKERLGYLNNLLEKNAKAFNQLFGDASVALQMGRLSILNSPSLPKNTFLSRVRHVQPGPSKTCTASLQPVAHTVQLRSSPRKLHIEPMNMQEFRTEVEHADMMRKPEDSINASSSLAYEGLSTIHEENVSQTRDVVVQLSRLPSEIMNKHLIPIPLSSNTSLNITDLFSSHMHVPSFTSTPSKVEAMQQLGLIPSRTQNENCPSNFVNTRRRRSGTLTIKTRHSPVGIISPKKEKKSLKRTSFDSPKVEHNVKLSQESVSGASPKNDKQKKKKRVAVSTVESKRPLRKARLMSLKEESPQKKKRKG